MSKSALPKIGFINLAVRMQLWTARDVSENAIRMETRSAFARSKLDELFLGCKEGFLEAKTPVLCKLFAAQKIYLDGGSQMNTQCLSPVGVGRNKVRQGLHLNSKLASKPVLNEHLGESSSNQTKTLSTSKESAIRLYDYLINQSFYILF